MRLKWRRDSSQQWSTRWGDYEVKIFDVGNRFTFRVITSKSDEIAPIVSVAGRVLDKEKGRRLAMRVARKELLRLIPNSLKFIVEKT